MLINKQAQGLGNAKWAGEVLLVRIQVVHIALLKCLSELFTASFASNMQTET